MGGTDAVPVSQRASRQFRAWTAIIKWLGHAARIKLHQERLIKPWQEVNVLV